MKCLLDTNTCIIYLRGQNQNLKRKLDSTPIRQIAVCSVVRSELAYGAMRSANPEKNLALQRDFLNQFISLPFDDQAAVNFGKIRAKLAALGTPIGAYDLQIAAIAMTHGLILVTHNTAEFQRVEGLQVEDWEIAT